MITFTFNGIDFAGDMKVNEVKGRGLTPTDVTLITVPGMTGAHAARKKRLHRTIEIQFTVVESSLTNLRNKINLLSERLDLDKVAPLVFSDEPDKTYYAILTGEPSGDDLVNYEQGTFTFVCPDPYKYGPEQTAILNTDTGATINVAGTAPTKPIIELTATTPSTYAMVANDKGEYNMIGTIADVETPKFSKYTVAFYHGMQNVTDWMPANISDVDHPIGGAVNSVTVNGDGRFQPNGFSNGTEWHGPAIKRSLPEPLQSFRMSARVGMQNGSNKKLIGNLEIYLLDVNGMCVARIGLRDGSSTSHNTFVQSRLGRVDDPKRHVMMNDHGARQSVWSNFNGMLRLERDGNRWYSHISSVDSKGKHYEKWTTNFTDTRGDHAAPITQVVVAFQQFGAHPTPTMYVTGLSVEKINKQAEGVPNIVYVDDSVEFDHNGKGRYYINGEDARRFKNFGARAFELEPGANTIAVEPGGSFTGTIRWRDAYK